MTFGLRTGTADNIQVVITNAFTTIVPPLGTYELRGELTDSGISDDEYCYAQTVWKEFSCKNIQVYHDLYVKTDVLLLCDVFENFRNFTLLNYNLDACHFYSAPGLSWLAMLRMTDVKIELFTHPNQPTPG